MSNFLIPEDHPWLINASPLTEYCSPLFKKYNLNYFQFVRVYQDGSTTVLTNQPNWTKFSIEYAFNQNRPAIYSCVKKEVLDPNNYYFLWEPNLPYEIVGLAKDFNIDNGLCFVERHNTHYDLIAFATPHENHTAFDFYLNHIGLLKDFICRFKHEQSDLIKTIEKSKLSLPSAQQDVNKNKMLSISTKRNEKISVLFRGKETYITRRELDCIIRLSFGKSAKKIALELGVSHRTVESYFERIKIRTGSKNKLDLISLVNVIINKTF